MRLSVLVALVGYVIAAPSGQVVIGQENVDSLHAAAISTPPVVNTHPRGHHSIDTNLTIYEWLKGEEDYSKLVKLIEYDELFVDVLNATTDDTTFFAPNNKALTPPKHHPHHGGDKLSLANLYTEYESLQALGDDDDEERKKRFKIILRLLLEYHTIPDSISRPALYVNSTYETALTAKEPNFGGQQRRLVITNDLIGRAFVNYYVTIDWKSVNSTTGYLYSINRPIIPPPSILDELFLIDKFSTLTSALQKVGLEDTVQWRWNNDSKKFEGGGPTVSLFAPDDWAFKRLPWRLRLYLFSPAGEKALKKLLSYHIVPNYILHSDFVFNYTQELDLKRSTEETFELQEDSTVPVFNLPKCARKARKAARANGLLEMKTLHDWPHHSPPNVTVNITVPTLLDNHSLNFVVIKPNTTQHHHHQFNLFEKTEVEENTLPPWFRSVVVAGGVPTGLEGVARNGAVYLVRRVLNPFKPHAKEEDSWNDWEDYLPAAWGEQ